MTPRRRRRRGWTPDMWVATSVMVVAALILADMPAEPDDVSLPVKASAAPAAIAEAAPAQPTGYAAQLDLARATFVDHNLDPSLGNYLVVEAAHWQIPPELLLAMCEVESSFKPEATSSEGAVGLMQLMPTTAAWIGRRAYGIQSLPPAALQDPYVSEHLGAAYLAYLRHIYPDWNQTLGAYNMGPSGYARWRAVHGPDTEYARKVLAAAATYKGGDGGESNQMAIAAHS